jgi:hypothetical protein
VTAAADHEWPYQIEAQASDVSGEQQHVNGGVAVELIDNLEALQSRRQAWDGQSANAHGIMTAARKLLTLLLSKNTFYQ